MKSHVNNGNNNNVLNNNNNNNNNNNSNNDDTPISLISRRLSDGYKGSNIGGGTSIMQQPQFGAKLFDNVLLKSPESFEKSQSYSSGYSRNYFDENTINKDANNGLLLGLGKEPLAFQQKSAMYPPLKVQPPLIIQQQQQTSKETDDTIDEKQNSNEEEIIFIQSKIPSLNLDDNNDNSPLIYNRNSSCAIKNEPLIILNDIRDLLNSFGNEIDFQVHKDTLTIEGVVFMRHRPIKWNVAIWKEQTENKSTISRVEFQKRSGNPIDFQHFWNDILIQIDAKFGTNNVFDAEYCNNFESLFLLPFDFCKPMEYDDTQLNNLEEQLRDDYHEIALEALGLLCTRLETDIQFRLLVSNHERLMQTLIKTVLNHVDSSHVRGALTSLYMIVTTNENCAEQLIGRHQILKTMIKLLTHQQTLVRKHAVRLLALLCQKEWQLTSKQCSQIKEQLQKLQNEWNITKNNDNNKDFVNWKMFDEIEKKVNKYSSSPFSPQKSTSNDKSPKSTKN